MVQTIADRVVVMTSGHCVANFDRGALDDMGRLDDTSLTARYLKLREGDSDTHAPQEP